MDTCLPESSNFLSLLTGSFSTPSGQNPTVAMIEAAYAKHGIAARYINCEVHPDDLAAAVRGAVAMNWLGFNCSIPHKIDVIRHLDRLGQSAELIGAVNCVVIRDGKLIGENTDGQGFMRSLRSVVDPAGKSMVILGAGGAARAIAVEASLAGVASIRIVNRNRERGKALARHIDQALEVDAHFTQWTNAFQIPSGTQILVNATSAGLYPAIGECPDIDFSTLQLGTVVADVIPNPPQTPFLQEAQKRGCTTLDGLGMLVNQGVASVKHWMGIDVDAEVMRCELERLFGR